MTRRRRLIVLSIAAVVAVAGAGVMGRLTGAPPSTLTVESGTEEPGQRGVRQTEPASEVASPQATEADTRTLRKSCGDMRMTTRGYGRVVAGDVFDVLTPDAGQLILIDRTDSVRKFRVRAERRAGEGDLFFQYADGRSRTAVMGEDTYRTAEGWPRHWGLNAVVTGPGCWHLHIRGDGLDERVVFAIDREQWRQAWRRTTFGTD